MEPKKSKPWHKFRKIDLKSIDKKSKKVEVATARHAHKFLLGRLENLQHIRRHLFGWLLLLVVLIGLNAAQVIFDQKYVSVQQPADGSAYAEGVLGPIDNLNPLFAGSDAEVSATKLIFSGLLNYDNNGHLQTDIAQSVEISPNGKTYTINLKPDIQWHDGKPVTAQDVAFTVGAMQNPQTGARQFSSWQNIQVVANGPRQVVFTLPTSYGPFASALTFPILPEHILGKIPPEQLQENDFRNKPIGSGPFSMLIYSKLMLVKIKKHYNSLDMMIIGQVLASYLNFRCTCTGNREDLVKGIQHREVNAASGVRVDAPGLKSVDVTLNNGVFALFRMDNPTLKDKNIRKALALGMDRQKLRTQLGGKKSLEGPIINSQTPLASQVAQSGYDFTAANQSLDASGWVKGSDGIRRKDGQPLELRVVAVDTSNYRKLTKLLAEQWRLLGIKMETQLIDPEQIQQIILRPRAYDILVYELSMGGDPDGYAFWHSSQVSGSGLNFSDYVSAYADDTLITARGRPNFAQRDAKYASFAQRWVEDVPAIALYRSSLHYTTTEGTYSISGSDSLVSATDRYYGVIDWASEPGIVYNTP